MQSCSGTVLIVDDDEVVATTIRDYLMSHGLDADCAADGNEMRHRFRAHRPDVVLLDIVLPREDGWSLMRELRARHGTESLGIILLTIKDELSDLIRGLDNGADDYIAKPFRMPELLSRVTAVLRRCQASSRWSDDMPTAWEFDGWQLNRRDWMLRRDGKDPVQLRPGEFAILDELLRHPHQTIDRETISYRTRQRGLGESDRSIDVMMSSLRQKLGDDARAPRWIKTVRGQGYSIGVDVRTA